MSDLTLLQRFRQPHIFHVIIVLTLYFSSVMLPSAITTDVITGYFNNGNECSTAEANVTPDCQNALQRATFLIGVTVALQSTLAFLSAPIVGQWSDSFGRVLPIFCSVFIVFLTSLALVGYQAGFLSLIFYFVMRGLCGLTEGMSIGLAYVSDITPHSQRLNAFGLLTACLSTSLVIAPFLGTMFSRDVIFPAASIVSLSALLYVALLLPESLKSVDRVPWKSTLQIMNPLTGMRILNRTRMFRRLAVTCFFVNLVLEGVFAVMIVYYKSQFVIDEKFQAMILAIWGLTGILAQTGLIRLITYVGDNQMVFRVGLILTLIATPLYGVVSEPWQVYAVLPINAAGMMIFPSISAMKANNVRASEQGTVQGALYAVRALGGICGPLIFTGAFATFSNRHSMLPLPYIPSMPFILGTLFAIIAVILGFTVPKKLSDDESAYLLDTPLGKDGSADEQVHIRSITSVDANGKLQYSAHPINYQSDNPAEPLLGRKVSSYDGHDGHAPLDEGHHQHSSAESRTFIVDPVFTST